MRAATFEATAIPKQENQLNQLVTFEKGLENTPLDHTVQVKLSSDGKTIDLLLKNRKLTSVVERPIIHQLGARAWGHDKTYKEIRELWGQGFKKREDLEQELSEIFRGSDLVARSYRASDGADKIYGVVSPNFVDVNQFYFRELFIEHARQKMGFIPQSFGITQDALGNVIEYFDILPQGFQTEYKYGLVYARNSGYQSYKVTWGRLVIVCSNGLVAFKESRFRWNHTCEVNLTDFIGTTLDEGVKHQKWFEERIDAARSRTLPMKGFVELLNRLSLAKASKNRIEDRLKIEAKDVGANEWALSQTLTWLGTYEKAIPQRARTQLTGLGTNMTEKSLEGVLAEETKLNRDGTHGIVLPTNLRSAS